MDRCACWFWRAVAQCGVCFGSAATSSHSSACLAGTICCFVSAVSHSTLICGTSPGLLLPLGVLLSEPGAFGKCLGCPAQGRCQELCGLPSTTCRTLSLALVLGGLALDRGLMSSISRLRAPLSTLEPAVALKPVFRLVLLSRVAALIS